MRFIERRGARCARRTRLIRSPLIAAGVCWLLAPLGARAQAAPADTPQPTASAPSGTAQTPAPPEAPRTAWRALETDEPGAKATPARRVHGDLAGSLGWEIAGALIPSVTGVALLLASVDPGSGGGHVPSFRVNLALFSFSALLILAGPPTGVAIAGSATGGTGGAGYAFLGALAGLPLSLPGMLIGSILGYRLSADDAEDVDDSRCMISPVIADHEFGLRWSGQL